MLVLRLEPRVQPGYEFVVSLFLVDVVAAFQHEEVFLRSLRVVIPS